MYEHEIDIVQLQFVEVFARRLIGIARFLHFRDQVKLRAFDAAPVDAVANAGLGPIISGRIDHAISRLESRGDSSRRIVCQLPRAKAQNRHLVASVQLYLTLQVHIRALFGRQHTDYDP
jgi:hypothetical protein